MEAIQRDTFASSTTTAKKLNMRSGVTHFHGEPEQANFPVRLDLVPPPNDGPLLSRRNNQGLFFTRDIAANTLVFEEQPFLLVPRGETFVPAYALEKMLVVEHYGWEMVEACLETKTDNEIQTLIEMQYAYGRADKDGLEWRKWPFGKYKPSSSFFAEESSLPQPPTTLEELYPQHGRDKLAYLYDVFVTNDMLATHGDAINVYTMQFVTYAAQHGFFLCLARANHACEPSVRLEIPALNLDPKNKDVVLPTVKVYTRRNVRRGEELTFDYNPARRMEKTKRQALLESHGFRCACVSCQPLCTLLSCSLPATLTCNECNHIRYCSPEHALQDLERHKQEECFMIQRRTARRILAD